jgi:hypothetical protein
MSQEPQMPMPGSPPQQNQDPVRPGVFQKWIKPLVCSWLTNVLVPFLGVLLQKRATALWKKPEFRAACGRIIVAALLVGMAGLLVPTSRHLLTRPLGFLVSEANELLKVIDEEVLAEENRILNLPLPGMVPPEKVEYINTGLTNSELRLAWHRTPEGSDVFPLALFRALRDPVTQKPFIEVMDRFGFITTSEDDTGLPVGFSRVLRPGDPFVRTGFNCAACHSAQISYRGRTLQVDGAPNQIDVEAFFRGTLEALKSEVESTDGIKFAARFLVYNAKERLEMEKQGLLSEPEPMETSHERLTLGFLGQKVAALEAILHSFREQTPAGPGRADSFGIIRNLMMTKALVGADNFLPMTAPVSIPHLFGFGSFTNLHWDGNTTTGNDRNYAQAIALGADFDPATKISSVDPNTLYTMEVTAQKLVPPKWPADIFGALKPDRVERGAKLFASQCADCHAGESWHPLDTVKTDPNRLRNYNIPLSVFGGLKESYATNLYRAAIAVRDKAYETHKVPKDQQDIMNRWHEGVEARWIETGDQGYFTRPLRGVWATAPFLHNNSVPTLWALLSSAEKRPRKFAVGHREFDPERVGFIADPEKRIWELDTSITGNSNTGHEFGTRLADEDKWALIEYLKTL